MGLGHSPSIVQSGLALCLYPGNIKSYSGSGSTITDLSGAGNNFTLNGSPYVNYGFGRSLTYSGAQTLSSSFTPSNTWSISMWFNNTSTYNIHNRGLFSTYSTSSFNGCYVGTTTAAANSMRVWYNSNGYSLINYSFAVNSWYQLTITCDGTTLVVYVNGVAVNSITTATTHANTLAIGQTRFDNNYWIGNIGQTLVYSRALTASEALQNYNASRGRIDNFYSPPPITSNLLVSLDAGNPNSYSGSGTAWNDISGNGNNATLVNSPTFDTGNGGSFVFNRTTNYATLPFTTTLTNCTFNFWFKATSTASYQYLLSLGNGSTSSYALHFDMNDPDLGSTGQTMWVYWNSGGTPYSALSRSGTYGDFQDSTWRNYCFVRNNSDTGTITRHYVNGVERSSGVSRSGDQTTQFGNGAGYNCRIAVFHNAANNFFGGNIASVQIYNAALSPIQIAQNFNSLRGRFGL